MKFICRRVREKTKDSKSSDLCVLACACAVQCRGDWLCEEEEGR